MSDSKQKSNKPKNKGGRPKEKVEDKVDFLQVEKLAGHNMTDVEIGDILGFCEDTINNYKKDEGFLRALKRGKIKADNRVVQSLYQRAVGRKVVEKTFKAVTNTDTGKTKMILVKATTTEIPPDVKACIHWLHNRRPQDWRAVKEEAGVPDDLMKPGEVEDMIADAEKRAGGNDNVCH